MVTMGLFLVPSPSHKQCFNKFVEMIIRPPIEPNAAIEVDSSSIDAFLARPPNEARVLGPSETQEGKQSDQAAVRQQRPKSLAVAMRGAAGTAFASLASAASGAVSALASSVVARRWKKAPSAHSPHTSLAEEFCSIGDGEGRESAGIACLIRELNAAQDREEENEKARSTDLAAPSSTH
jgi:hypothetical protein